MRSIVGSLWFLAMIGTVIAHLVGGEFVLALRILVGSVVGTSIGFGSKALFYNGQFVQGIGIGLVALVVGWAVLPSSLKIGPALWVPGLVWLMTSAAIGFLLGRREDAELRRP